MKLIPLTGKHSAGKFAIVDDEDYDFLMQWNWYAGKDPSTGNLYVRRTETQDEAKKEKRKRSTVAMHRVLLALKYGDPNKGDHRDLNPLNNQKENLRIATHAENVMNTHARKNSSSSYLGVSVKTQKRKTKKDYLLWMSQLTHNGKTLHLGCFPYTPEGEIAAAKCYDVAAKKYHGEFANLNFK